MDAQERVRIKELLHRSHRSPEKMCFRRSTDPDVVLFRINPPNVRDRQEPNSAARLEDDARRVRRGSCVTGGFQAGWHCGFTDLRSRPFDRNMQSLSRKWLEKIIDRIELKCPQGIVIVGSGK